MLQQPTCVSWVVGSVIVLIVAWSDRADAGPFYVQAIATTTTSGNILDGHSFTHDTGQVQATSTSAGPFSANSGGALYSLSATAGTVTELGAIHGHATA